MLKLSKDSFKSKYIYLISGFVIGVMSTSIFFLYLQNEDDIILLDEQPLILDDTIANNDLFHLDTIEVDNALEDEDMATKSTKEQSKQITKTQNIDQPDAIPKSYGIENEERSKELVNISRRSKTMQINDVKNIARTLKGSSISAKTIIHEINRIVRQENNSKVTGATIAQALSHKLPNSTKNRLIKNVDYIAISNNIIHVKLKGVSNIKLTFKTDEGRKTIKVYDGATIKINNQASKVSAEAKGFSYQHLGMLWQIKSLLIQQKNQTGTLDIKLKGKLKDVELPTITLGNLYRKIL